jgi:hypothetical protein
MACLVLSPEGASHVILTKLRRVIISTLQLSKVCREWKEPKDDRITHIPLEMTRA